MLYLREIVFIALVSFLIITWNSKYFDPKELVGKNVLVTGASSGIGKAVAIQYAKYGANVFITARREKQLKEVVALCKEAGRADAKFTYVVADMKKYKAETKRVVQDAVRFLGGLDHVILNHALLQAPETTGNGWNGSEEQLKNIEEQIDTGLLSYVYLTAHALPYLRQSNPGRIAVIGSLAGKATFRSAPSYASVKFGLDGFYSSLRELFEHDGTNITITYHVIGPVDVGRNITFPANLANAERLAFLLSRSVPEATAEQIVGATTRGDAELYFPHLFGFIRGGYRIFPILRHFSHNLLYAS